MLGHKSFKELLSSGVPSLTRYGCVAFDMDYTLARCHGHASANLNCLAAFFYLTKRYAVGIIMMNCRRSSTTLL
jgi:hypothetical protein